MKYYRYYDNMKYYRNQHIDNNILDGKERKIKTHYYK